MGNLTHTVSGDIASFRSAARVPIESLKCHFKPIQEGSGDPSPENIRPISGWTGCKINKMSKNGIHIIGYSATSISSPTATRFATNDYGTTLSTINYSLPDTPLVVTQNNYSTTPIKSYRNGYIVIIEDNLEYNKQYQLILKVTNITNNPLNAQLTDWSLMPPSGAQIGGTMIDENRIRFKFTYQALKSQPNRHELSIRICGMSFTLSECMILNYNETNYEWEPYCGDIIPITFPVLGKNKLNPAYRDDTYSNNIIYYRESRITLPAGTYTLSTSTSNVSLYVYQGPNSQQTTLFVKYNASSLTFTLNEDTNDLWFNFYTGNGIDHTATCQLELNSDVTTYEPYNPDNTVYGGYIDIAKGELVKEYDSYTFTGIQDDQLSYHSTGISQGAERHIFRSTKLDRLPQYTSTSLAYMNIAVSTTNGSAATPLNIYIGTPSDQIIFYIKSDLCEDTVQSFSNWLSNNPVQLVYKLKNPVSYPLSKQELNSFLDRNNVWSNTNDITEVSYEIHDSNMIQQAKKNIMSENTTHYKKVLWNQRVRPLTSEHWRAYNTSNNTVTFSNEVATSTWLTGGGGYSHSIRNQVGTAQYDKEYWYASYMVKPSEITSWGIEMCGGRQIRGIVTAPADTWTLCSARTSYYRGTNNYLYICNCSAESNSANTNLIAEVKSPIHINLTAMFGPGNEPTKTEFEYLCKINNVDLTTYHPYDIGTEQIWYIPDHNIDNYTSVNWNQLAKPVNADNYSLHTESAGTLTFENGVATRTITKETTNDNCYITAIRSKYTFVAQENHIYYAKEELNSEVNKNYVISYANNWHVKTITPNQWSIIEDIFTWNGNVGTKYVFFCYRNNASSIGEVCQARNPILIDLTEMFGSGNEPTTTTELRTRCLKNNINLDEAQPYNAGTKMIWKV